MKSWEQWRWDALTEAARQVVFGHNWWEMDAYRGYVQGRAANVPYYRKPVRW